MQPLVDRALRDRWGQLDRVHLPAAALDEEGLTSEVERAFDKDLFSGAVMEMEPPMAAVIREGGTVTLTVTTSDAEPKAGAASSP